MSSGLTPHNFDHYLPWACHQFQIEIDLIILSDIEATHGTKRTPASARRRPGPETKTQLHKTASEHVVEKTDTQEHIYQDGCVVINTVYDSNDNIITLKFLKNKHIPKTLLKVIAIILKFHVLLNNITIDRGLNNESLFEVSKLLEVSNVTELCLDNTHIPHGCYYLFLEKETRLKQLSLRRCNIDEEIVEIMASRLIHPLPASKHLTILNLASNNIKDAGAKYLAECLKVNRLLVYLNISDNAITDEGAEAILDTLKEFPITPEELIVFRTRYINDCKEKLESLIPLEEDKTLRPSQKKTRSKSITAAQGKKKHVEKETQTMKEHNEFEKDCKDPFYPKNRFTRNGRVYSYGNHHLSYLNLSYNSLSYLSVKRLLDVMLYQQMAARIPRGLVSICIEGNYIPDKCSELDQIDEILKDILREHSFKHTTKKRPMERLSIATGK